MQAGRALTKLSRIANLRMNFEAVLAALEATLGDREAKVRGAAAVSLAAASSTVNPPAALAAILEDESAGIRSLIVRIAASYPRGLARSVKSQSGPNRSKRSSRP